jgi:RNA polymerase sigma factor (sigma-70 family)
MDEFDDRLSECRRRLIAFTRHRLPRSDRDWGSDYVQDAMVEAHQRAEIVRLLTPDQTYAWLLTVLKLKMANACRARRQAKRKCSRECGIDAIPPNLLVDRAANPSEAADQNERSERIASALRTLTDGQRLAIVLNFYGKWTLEEIGKELGIARSSVLGLIRRGLSQLSKCGVLSVADLASTVHC